VQNRFEVAVGAVLWKTPSATLHVVSAAHVRSEVASGALVWNWVVVQPVIEAQVRSVVTPGAVAWYCVEVHVVRLVHARLLVVVALAVSYSSLVEQLLWAAHSRFWA
jgi:hypothetical protein